MFLALFASILSALAADPTPLSPVAIHRTWFVVAGSDTFQNAPDLPDTGATEDCRAITVNLTNRYGIDQVLPFCGEDLSRGRFYASVDTFLKLVQSGDSLFVIWLGTGGTDPFSEARVWPFSDGSFDLSQPKPGLADRFQFEALAPERLDQELESHLPPDVQRLYVLDTAHHGTWKTLSLHGPAAIDLRGLDVLAISPIGGIDEPSQAFRATVISCTDPRLAADSGTISAQVFRECLQATALEKGIFGTEQSGKWEDPRPVIFVPPSVSLVPVAPPVAPPVTPPSIPVAPPAVVTKKTISMLPIVRWGSFGVGVGTAAAGFFTYSLAHGVYEQNVDVKTGNFPADKADELARYRLLRTATFALWGAGGVGAIGFGSSFLIVSPDSVSVAVRF